MPFATIAVRLPNEDVRKLELLAEIRGTTPAEVIRSALEDDYREAFGQAEQITLSNAAYESVLDYLEHRPSEAVLAKRSHLFDKYSGWN